MTAAACSQAQGLFTLLSTTSFYFLWRRSAGRLTGCLVEWWPEIPWKYHRDLLIITIYDICHILWGSYFYHCIEYLYGKIISFLMTTEVWALVGGCITWGKWCLGPRNGFKSQFSPGSNQNNRPIKNLLEVTARGDGYRVIISGVNSPVMLITVYVILTSITRFQTLEPGWI